MVALLMLEPYWMTPETIGGLTDAQIENLVRVATRIYRREEDEGDSGRGRRSDRSTTEADKAALAREFVIGMAALGTDPEAAAKSFETQWNRSRHRRPNADRSD
jgi:hypothetical protein